MGRKEGEEGRLGVEGGGGGGVEERRFTYREGSLVVCHRILSLKENEEKQREEEGEDRALNTSGV